MYILSGLSQDPSEFNNDIEIKGQTSLKVTSMAFPSLKASFVALVQVHGFNTYTDAQIGNLLLVDFDKLPAPQQTE